MTTAWTTNEDCESVVALLRACAESCPDELFLDFSGRTYTYGEMWESAAALANGFRALGVERNQTVVTMLDNNEDGVAAWFAANMLGAIWVGVNTALRGEFLRHVVADAGARVVVCEADLAERVLQIDDALNDVEVLLVRGELDGVPTGSTRLKVDALADHRAPAPGFSPQETGAGDVSLLVYTGGTTGPSKGCTITHGYVANLARRFLQQTGRTRQELNWSPLPMYHFNLVSQTIAGTMLLRGSASVARRFSVSGFWPEIERTGAQVVNLLGSMGALIAQMPDTLEMKRCFGQIRVVHGAPFPPELQETWRTRFGVEMVGGTAYGLTEAVPLTTLDYGLTPAPGSSGKRNDRDFDVRIFDDEDREVGPGEVGEIVARPKRPNVMFQGYWRRPEATVAATGNLWFHTGDLGRFDEEGFFYFVDRKKDYLRRRGENISSLELEATYLAHPDIAQAAVHAVLSDLTEDDIKLTAVLVEGATLTPTELFEWSKDLVPYYALPRYIEFRAELPMSTLGRVHKYQLRDEGCTPTTWDREREDVTWERR